MKTRKSRKTFWGRFSAVMAVLMLVLASVGMVTVGAVDNEPRHSQKDVMVVGDVDNLKTQLITNAIYGEDVKSKGIYEEITPYFNILCLFGHNTAETTAYLTEHYYYSTAPKCKETTYDVTYCTRSGCDFVNYVQISVNRVRCCS